MSTTTINKTVFFSAPKQLVWSFLIDKDKLGEWYHPAKASLAEGESYTLYRIGDGGDMIPQVTGEVLEMSAPDKLVTTFCIGPFGENSTKLTWRLDDAAGGTRLHLTHEGIADASGEAAMHLLTALDHGWDQHFGGLRAAVKSVAEKG